MDTCMSITLWPRKLSGFRKSLLKQHLWPPKGIRWHCSQEIANWIHHYGYAEIILKIICTHQLAHVWNLQRVGRFEGKAKPFQLLILRIRGGPTVVTIPGEKKFWLWPQGMVGPWIYLISSGSSFHHQIPSENSSGFAITIVFIFLEVVWP